MRFYMVQSNAQQCWSWIHNRVHIHLHIFYSPMNFCLHFWHFLDKTSSWHSCVGKRWWLAAKVGLNYLYIQADSTVLLLSFLLCQYTTTTVLVVLNTLFLHPCWSPETNDINEIYPESTKNQRWQKFIEYKYNETGERKFFTTKVHGAKKINETMGPG